MRERKQLSTILIPALITLALGVLPASAITWGQPDAEHRNVGAMVLQFEGFRASQFCSGTLIHPRLFLTAAHCTSNDIVDAGPAVRVNFDQDALNPATLLPVVDVITHPDYYWGPTSNPFEVGILVLAEAVTDIEPAVLPSAYLLDDLLAAGVLRQGSTGAKFTMVGYGNSFDTPPPVYHNRNRRQYSISEYQELLKSWLRLSQNQATGDGGTCYGDSGGPAFWTAPDGREILVGVTSWGDASCRAAGFNYRVDIPDTLDFIADVIESLPPIP